jgi:hypothetical protein
MRQKTFVAPVTSSLANSGGLRPGEVPTDQSLFAPLKSSKLLTFTEDCSGPHTESS